jgi:hypothetical protein
MYRTLYSCPILMKLEFSVQVFIKPSSIEFHENPSSESHVVPCGRTDMTKLIVAFRFCERVSGLIHQLVVYLTGNTVPVMKTDHSDGS